MPNEETQAQWEQLDVASDMPSFQEICSPAYFENALLQVVRDAVGVALEQAADVAEACGETATPSEVANAIRLLKDTIVVDASPA